MDSQGLMCFAGAFALMVGWNRLKNGREVINKRKRSSYHHYRKQYDPRTTHWYIDFVIGEKFNDPLYKDKIERRFRRLFGVPRSLFLYLVSRSKAESWFPPYSRVNDDGLPLDITGLFLLPVEIKILCALIVLTKGVSFHTVSEFSQGDGHSETHRTFFHLFTETMVTKLFAEHVHLPRTEDELNNVMKVYALLGYPGCCFSMDCVHIKWKGCPFRHRNMYHSYKNNFPCISYNVTCDHSGKINTVSTGCAATCGDSVIVTYDLSVLPLLNDPLFKDKEYTLYSLSGETATHKGVYGLTDNGYFCHPLFAFPFKNSLHPNFIHWSKRTESVRKDIECVFGRLKVRFEILNHYIKTQDKVKVDRIFKTCCILHNMILKWDGYDTRLQDTSNWIIQTQSSENQDSVEDYRHHLNNFYSDNGADDDETRRENVTSDYARVGGIATGSNISKDFIGIPIKSQFQGLYESTTSKVQHKLHMEKLVQHYAYLRSKNKIYWPKTIR